MLWYTMSDPANPSANYARVEVKDASGTQQTGTALGLFYNASSQIIWVSYADTDGNLWYTQSDSDDASINYARVEVKDASRTQQRGTAIDLSL